MRVASAVHRVAIWVRMLAAAGGVVAASACAQRERAVRAPPCGGFDFPVGRPDAHGYYDAQPFGVNDHTGNDWNGNGGNDTDLGDPVYAVAPGIVAEAIDHGGGWGNVIRVVHDCGGARIESLYAHLDVMATAAGAPVARGQQIGTIGTAGGQYRAHLHFELRERDLPLGAGYTAERAGYLDATAYIRAHRPAP